jgi:hypothetical protein
MHILYDEDEWETVSTSRPCTTCQGDRRKCHGVGCNGMASIGSRRRAPEEVAKIKAERRRKEEDEILAKAAAIRFRRGEM